MICNRIGVYQDKDGSNPRNCSYMYINGIYEGSLLLENYIIFRPFACLPVFNYPTVVCRFSPVQYQIKENENNGQMAILNLPYHFGYIMNI